MSTHIQLSRYRSIVLAFGCVTALLIILNLNGRLGANYNTTTSVFNKQAVSYAPRLNMGKCPKRYGQVAVFVAVLESSYKKMYRVAMESLRCYLKSVDYDFYFVDMDHDEEVKRYCKHKQVFYKRHCAAAIYLRRTDWMLFLDADMGVVNPNHCIEEWIDDRVDIIFYERFFNWEIASGSYLVRNTEFARNFLMKYADWEFIQPASWTGSDNGALMMHILQTVMPEAPDVIHACQKIWERGTSYETYMAFVTCVKVTLGIRRFYPGQLRVLRRAHGWVRDGHLTGDAWSERDFFMHDWKKQSIGAGGWDSPFAQMFNVSDCEPGSFAGWNWRPEKRLSVDAIRQLLAAQEKFMAKEFPTQGKVLPYLIEPDIGLCYPNCKSV